MYFKISVAEVCKCLNQNLRSVLRLLLIYLKASRTRNLGAVKLVFTKTQSQLCLSCCCLTLGGLIFCFIFSSFKSLITIYQN